MRALAILSLVASTVPSMTAHAAAQETRTVRVTGFDPSDPRHRKLLDRRMSRAVEAVCGSYASVAHSDEDGITRCRREAIAGVARQLARRRAHRSELVAAR